MDKVRKPSNSEQEDVYLGKGNEGRNKRNGKERNEE
jgi:hypothetical protein